MIHRTFVAWNAEKEPDAPREWDPEKHVVLVRRTEAFGKASTSTDRVADRELVRFTEKRGIVVAVYDLKDLRQRTRDVFPDRVIPGLSVERQADLTEQALRVLCCLRACHRAIVATPREALAVGLLGTLPQAWGIGCKQLEEFVQMVVVRGPLGPGAWPMHPRWVEKIRDEAREAGVAFAFVGWGEWGPRTREVRRLDDEGRWGEAKRLGEHGRDMLEPGAATDDMGDDCILQRMGWRRAGRLLARDFATMSEVGEEHGAVPASLDPEAPDPDDPDDPDDETIEALAADTLADIEDASKAAS
jgi:hypothetical protein